MGRVLNKSIRKCRCIGKYGIGKQEMNKDIPTATNIRNRSHPASNCTFSICYNVAPFHPSIISTPNLEADDNQRGTKETPTQEEPKTSEVSQTKEMGKVGEDDNCVAQNRAKATTSEAQNMHETIDELSNKKVDWC